MPKILRIINRFNLGGPTYNAAYLSKYLPSEYETMLIGGYHESGEESSTFIIDSLGIPYTQLSELKRSIHPINDYKAYKRIVEIIKDFKPDIVHTHASKAGAIGRLAASACNVPVIIHTFHGHVFHSYFGKAKTEFYKNLERYLAKKCSKIIAISKQQAHELVDIHQICERAKIEIIPLGFALERFSTENPVQREVFRQRYSVASDEIAVGIIGRLAPIKNHRLFLEAFAVSKSSSKQKIKALIIGDGDTKESLQVICKELNLSYSMGTDYSSNLDVIFCGWIKDISEALPGLDIVALSSLNEGTPVSLIEAQSAGIPVLSTNVGGVQDILVNGKTGLITESFNPNEFASKLSQLIENPEEREQFGKEGRDFARSKFHYTRMVHDHEILYKALLNSK